MLYGIVIAAAIVDIVLIVGYLLGRKEEGGARVKREAYDVNRPEAYDVNRPGGYKRCKLTNDMNPN